MVLIKEEEDEGLLDHSDTPDRDVLEPDASRSDVDIEDLVEALEEYGQE